MKKIALYTAVFGHMSRFVIPRISDKSIDRFCFTNLDYKNDFYQMRYMKLPDIRPSVIKQRFIKILIPDEIFNNYEYSVYVDCKRPVKVNFDCLLSCLEKESDLLTRPHKKRSCIYDEGLFCIKKRKGSKDVILKQLDSYKSQGYPKRNGLHASGLLLRRHTEEIKKFNALWWLQVMEYSHRDQISLPYVAWKTDTKISLMKRRCNK